MDALGIVVGQVDAEGRAAEQEQAALIKLINYIS